MGSGAIKVSVNMKCKNTKNMRRRKSKIEGKTDIIIWINVYTRSFELILNKSTNDTNIS